MDNDDKRTVEVPAWALRFVLNHADLADDGPHGEGWMSPEMRAAHDALEAALTALK